MFTKTYALVFPARAGMSRKLAHLVNKAFCVPRASGDEPYEASRLFQYTACSPRERG